MHRITPTVINRIWPMREPNSELIVMTVRGHHGFLDEVRASTTEQVLRQANLSVTGVRSEAGSKSVSHT